MRNVFKITGALLAVLALSACGARTASSTATSTNTQTSNLAGGANNMTAFSPAGGTYNAMPTSITISFANSSVNTTAAQTSSYYSLICGTAVVASNVTYVSGTSNVTVTMPATLGLTEGEICTFAVSNAVTDGNGNSMGGTHSVNYTYSASGAAPVNNGGASSTWVESATVSYTSQIGNPVANVFHAVGATGAVMSGLNVNGTTYVDGLSGLWSSGFASTSSTAGPIQGNATETFTTLSCPAGYRMTGITGKSGSYIDSIGIVCKTQDQTQTYTSATFGGPGGSAYNLSCPAGQFVTDLGGTSGNYLDALYLGCR